MHVFFIVFEISSSLLLFSDRLAKLKQDIDTKLISASLSGMSRVVEEFICQPWCGQVLCVLGLGGYDLVEIHTVLNFCNGI